MIPRNGRWVCGGCESALVYRDQYDEQDWHCQSCGLVFSVWSIAEHRRKAQLLVDVRDQPPARGRPRDEKRGDEVRGIMARRGTFIARDLMTELSLSSASVSDHIVRARGRGLLVVETPSKRTRNGRTPVVYRWVGKPLAEAS